MGIMQGILDAAINAAIEAGAPRIGAIGLTIGETTEIQDFALHFAFDALSPGTIAEGASLNITFNELRSHCNECGEEFAHERYDMLCPHCRSFDLTTLQGNEMRIDYIETPDEAE